MFVLFLFFYGGGKGAPAVRIGIGSPQCGEIARALPLATLARKSPGSFASFSTTMNAPRQALPPCLYTDSNQALRSGSLRIYACSPTSHDRAAWKDESDPPAPWPLS